MEPSSTSTLLLIFITIGVSLGVLVFFVWGVRNLTGGRLLQTKKLLEEDRQREAMVKAHGWHYQGAEGRYAYTITGQLKPSFQHNPVPFELRYDLGPSTQNSRSMSRPEVILKLQFGSTDGLQFVIQPKQDWLLRTLNAMTQKLFASSDEKRFFARAKSVDAGGEKFRERYQFDAVDSKYRRLLTREVEAFFMRWPSDKLSGEALSAAWNGDGLTLRLQVRLPFFEYLEALIDTSEAMSRELLNTAR